MRVLRRSSLGVAVISATSKRAASAAMLFAQITAPPTRATTTPTVTTTPATQPSTPATADAPLDPQDARTTRDPGAQRDPRALVDARTTRDDAFDPRAPTADRAQRERDELRGGTPLHAGDGEPVTRIAGEGTDIRAMLSLVEGYNTNVQQIQSVADGPIVQHPSPFTGAEMRLTLRTWTAPRNFHEAQIEVRGQHYTPLDGMSQPDDGSVLGSWAAGYELGKRTTIAGSAYGTLSTLNASRAADGVLFMVEPSSMQRTFAIGGARIDLAHEIGPRVRYHHGVDTGVGTTIRDVPVALPNGAAFIHRGLDYIGVGTDGTLLYDFTDTTTGTLGLRYDRVYNPFLLDFERNPPMYRGRYVTHLGTGEVGLERALTEKLRSRTTVGVVVATPPPLDVDRRPIVSPMFAEELRYTTAYWLFGANAAYTYGSANPRLGFGPSLIALGMLEGTPFPHAGGLKDLAVLANTTASRTAFRSADSALSRFTYAAASVELRYALTRWLGLLGGYNTRWSMFEGDAAQPSFTQHVVFLGVSGYVATDRAVPTLTTFAPPLAP